MNYIDLPLAEWTEIFVDWLIGAFGPLLTLISDFLNSIITGIEDGLLMIPPEIVALFLVVLAWFIAGRSMAIFTLFGLLFIGSLDLWEETIQTLTLIIASTFLSVIIGVPLGILSTRYNTVDRLLRPILDFMQTMPSFVYLIPILLLFGIGRVPAVIATIIFSMPPAVRLTNLGIRQVPKEVIEAATSYGSTPTQMLFKVQLPMAIPTIMAGINQSIMLALSMTVIASMIAAPGLGYIVFASISRVEVGSGLEAGLAIVILAVFLDRITEALGKRKRNA
jgi:glycine betaine/proline transport system permease protein